MRARVFFVALFLLMPLPLLAEVTITEIMYDLPASDADGEWIEVQNVGSESIDLTKLKFLEAGVKHGINAAADLSILPSGAYAIIAEDTTKFIANNPSFSGSLFKSSFSLSNSGETLAIVDASSTPLDSISYASSQGAAGNGLSLQKTNLGWFPANPSRGRPLAQSDLPLPPLPPPQAPSEATTQIASEKEAGNASAPTAVTADTSTYSPMVDRAPGSSGASPYTWWLALGAVIVLGTGATFLLRTKRTPVSSEADEFEIVE